MTPGAQSQDLLYVPEVHEVAVYSYPAGKLVGKLKGFYETGGDCVDKAQDVWIADLGHNRMVEYAHAGTKPLRTLTNSGLGCAVDPAAGDLAVAQLGGEVLVWKQARGTPTKYSDSLITRAQFCAYDDRGNLFVDGANGKSDYEFVLAELPKGSSSLKTITVTQLIYWPGGLQWNKPYLVVGDRQKPVIYRFAIDGNQAKKVSATDLGGNVLELNQFFLDEQNQRVISPNEYIEAGKGTLSDVLYYRYPAGGPPTETIHTGHGYPNAVVVSRTSAL